MKKALSIALLLLLSSVSSQANDRLKKSFYDQNVFSAKQFQELKAKIQDRHINLHMVAHTHDDVGWLKTVDEYYSGTHNVNGIHANVQLIIDTVIDELIEDPNKKFTYVEMKFFELWWNQQTEEKKNTVRQLTQEGRLEFVNAGWSMHDEACPHYEDMINNMKYGNEFLYREVGFRPTIGWHVDPFGHSQANPRLFADMGLDAWFFARGDHADQDTRKKNGSMEFIWQPMYSHFGNSTQIFTHFLYDNLYCWIPGFTYDDRYPAGDQPVVIDPEMETFNADTKVAQLLQRVNNMLSTYQGDNLFMTFGCDFAYANAHQNFMQMDRLIKYFNSHVDNMTIFYSTPETYLKAIKAQNLTYPVSYYDMMPYTSSDNDAWTGFYTSKANLKKIIRDGSANLHASNKIFALRALDQHTTDEEIEEMMNAANEFQDAMGVSQHHDGVTGTAKVRVAADYIWRIFKAMNQSNAVYSQVIEELISYYSNIQSSEWTWCQRMNGTYLDCPIANNLNKDHIVVIHNPSLYDQTYIRMKVSHGNYTIQQWHNDKLVFNIIPTAAVICVDRVVESGDTVHDCDLHIKSTFGASAFTILQLTYNTSVDLTVKESTTGKHMISSNNETLNYTGTDNDKGVLFDLVKTYSKKTYKIAFNFEFYFSYISDDDNEAWSGVYTFKPMTNTSNDGTYANLTSIKSFNSDIVNEIFMQFSNQNGTQKIDVKLRYYDESLTSEWEVYMHEIPEDPVSDPKTNPPGREVVVVWKSLDIQNNKTFYTDSNGLELQKRILGYQPAFQIQTVEPISSNYYPINSGISVVDEEKQLQMTVMNDRSQGGSSLEDGKIEIMQNRRVFADDGKGVDEYLNETDQYGNGISVPATYRLEFIERNLTMSSQRNIQLMKDEPLQIFFTFNYTLKQNNIMHLYQSPQVTLNDASIPAAVKYLLFPLEKNKIHIRLENIGDRFDTDHWNLTANSSVVVPLGLLCQKLFDEANHKNTSIKLTNIIYVETSLNGVYEISEMRNSKTKWNVNTTTTQPIPAPPVNYPSQDVKQDYNNIVLEQQRIRSFNVTFVVQDSYQKNNIIYLS